MVTSSTNARHLLRRYLREVIGPADPRATGKDVHGGNLYALGSPSLPPAHVRGRGSNILDDELAGEERALQDDRQAACCLILGGDGTVLAVSRKDDPTAYGMPGGKVDPGETPEEAAARELQEETGLVATSLQQVFVHREADGFTTTTFVCEVEGEIDTDEAGVVRWVSPEALFNGPFGDYNRKLWARLGLPTR